MKNFKIGDRVINSGKTLAPIQKGTIVGVVTGEFFFSRKGDTVFVWDLKFPDWRTKLVYFVDLDIESPPIASQFYWSFDESVRKKQKALAFAEDDLLLLEEALNAV